MYEHINNVKKIKKNLKIQEDAVLITRKQNTVEVILQIPSSSSPISHGEVTNADKMKIR